MEKTNIMIKMNNLGCTIKGYELFMWLKKYLTTTVDSAEMQKRRCLVFTTSKDVKTAFEELQAAGILKEYHWSHGKVSGVKMNAQMVKDLISIPETNVVKIERPKKGKSKIEEVPEGVAKIIKCNNEIKPFKNARATKRIVELSEAALNLYSVEDVNEAILYSSQQEWLVNKADSGVKWFNLAWLLKNISGFMPGGKYRKNEVPNEIKTIIDEEEDYDSFTL